MRLYKFYRKKELIYEAFLESHDKAEAIGSHLKADEMIVPLSDSEEYKTKLNNYLKQKEQYEKTSVPSDQNE